MRCTYRWQLMAVAVAIVSMFGASAAFAVPYSPSVAEIQSLGNDTSNFSGGLQLSTIDNVSFSPDGIHVDVTWRVGAQVTDPFGENYGETFSRIVLDGFQNNENGGAGRLLFPIYDGIKWCFMSDTPLTVQPFILTPPNYSYYQPLNDPQVPGDMSNTMVALNFNSTNPALPLDINGEIRSYGWGFQIFGPSPTPGTSVQSQIWIRNWVPEPSSAVLLLIGLVGLVGRTRRQS